jgi:Fic family protein
MAPLFTTDGAKMTAIQDLLKSIKTAKNGASLNQLTTKHPDISRRTVQRWVRELADSQQIEITGYGATRRYWSTTQLAKPPQTNNSFPDYIPLSEDSKDILTYLEQPLGARHPVGYQSEFLEAYSPNKTYYLPATIRHQLHAMGNTQETSLPAGTYGRAILDRLLIDLSWASSHLEGNTYSRLDTRKLIEEGKAAKGKAIIETQMILNHKKAIELLVDDADSVNFNRFTVMNIHSALAENLLDNALDEGRIRQHLIGISKSVFRPLSVPSQINEQLDLMLKKARQIKDPFEQSFFVMVHLPYLQAFADINKRTSRLMANLPLIKANLCPLTFLGVPEKAYSRAILGVYEMTRVELLRDLYFWAYQQSTREYLTIKQDLVQPDPLRLEFREETKKIVHDLVVETPDDTIKFISQQVNKLIKKEQRTDVQALVIEEIRRLHEGVLARYGLRPAEFKAWKSKQK